MLWFRQVSARAVAATLTLRVRPATLEQDHEVLT